MVYGKSPSMVVAIGTVASACAGAGAGGWAAGLPGCRIAGLGGVGVSEPFFVDLPNDDSGTVFSAGFGSGIGGCGCGCGCTAGAEGAFTAAGRACANLISMVDTV